MNMNIGYNGKVFMNGQYLGDVVDFQLKDSGKREDFSTGSRRDTREGKGRFDLISPRFLRRLAKVLEAGAKKYGPRNWEKGQPLSRYLDSWLRHSICVMLGMKDEDHAGQAGWNIHSFIHTAELIEEGKLPRELDDIGYCTFPGRDEVDERAEATEDEYLAEASDVAGRPPFSVDNPCGSPDCVICYPKEREASLPATSSKANLTPLAFQLKTFLFVRMGGQARVVDVLEYFTRKGFLGIQVYNAAKGELKCETVNEPGGPYWRLPEVK